MKRFAAIVITLSLSITLVSGFLVQNASAAKVTSKLSEQEEYSSVTIIVEYQNNEPISETIITEGDIDESVITVNEKSLSKSMITYAAENEGGLDYKLIDTFTGTSKVLDKLSEWAARFTAAVIPAYITKSIWVVGASSSAWETFYNPPTTRYYTTKIYQTEDSWNYYGKHISYEYSDSAKTKLTKTVTHITKKPKP